MGVYDKAVLYHFFHALGPSDSISDSAARGRPCRQSAGTWVCGCFSRDTAVFWQVSYALALSGVRILGAGHTVRWAGVSGAWFLTGLAVISDQASRLTFVFEAGGSHEALSDPAACPVPCRCRWDRATPDQAIPDRHPFIWLGNGFPDPN